MGRIKFLCFPSHLLAVAKRSRHAPFSPVSYPEDNESYERNGIVNLRQEDKTHSQPATSELELASLLSGSSLERPAGVNVILLWNYAPCHATDIGAKKGERVQILYRNGEWVFVENGAGSQGFIPFNFCSLPKDSKSNHPKQEKEEGLRVFETEEEVPSVIELKRNSTKEKIVASDNVVGDRETSCELNDLKSHLKNPECSQLLVVSNNKSVESSVHSVKLLTRNNEDQCIDVTNGNEPALKSNVLFFHESGLKNSTSKKTDQAQDIKVLDLKNLQAGSKTSESSNNETSSVHSDNSEKRKGLGFLSRKLRKENSIRKKEKKKKKHSNATRHVKYVKQNGPNPSNSQFGMDSWDWYLSGSDSSSDTSDEETSYDEESRVKSHCNEEFREAFVTGTILPPKVVPGFTLTKRLATQSENVLMTRDGVSMSPEKSCRGNGIYSLCSKARHLSWLVDEGILASELQGAKSQEFCGGFAQVRKLSTNAQLEELQNRLAKFRSKELCVPKPKCLIDEENNINMVSSDGLSFKEVDEDFGILEERLEEDLMVVAETFEAKNSDDLNVTAGDKVFVCNACGQEDWCWATTMDGREGFLPKHTIVPLVNDDEPEDTYVNERQNLTSEIQNDVVEKYAFDSNSNAHCQTIDSRKHTSDNEESIHGNVFPRLSPLSDRRECQPGDKKLDASGGKGALKMAMVAPTLRSDVLSSSHSSEEENLNIIKAMEEEITVKPPLITAGNCRDGHKFHSYENINSELFLDSVRKQLKIIDSKDKGIEVTDMKTYQFEHSFDSTDDEHDPSWVAAYLDRYTNRLNKPRDDKPRALRRRETIASSKVVNKRVRFNSGHSNQDDSDCNGPLVVIHRYEVESQEKEEWNRPSTFVKNSKYGEMELATWC